MVKVRRIGNEPFTLKIDLHSVDILAQTRKLGDKKLGRLTHSNFRTFGWKSRQCLDTEGFIGSSFPLPALDYLEVVEDPKGNDP